MLRSSPKVSLQFDRKFAEFVVENFPAEAPKANGGFRIENFVAFDKYLNISAIRH